MNGLAYVFLRKDGAALPVGWAGHVGWGFLLEDNQTFYCGSTENDGGNPLVPIGSDNGWWGSETADEQTMVSLMRLRNYDAYKMATVRNADPASARKTADGTKTYGYTLIANNCLNHLWYVLSNYGVRDLPLIQLYPYPNQWFAMFNGEYHNIVPL